jgi:predicted dehydrogenase
LQTSSLIPYHRASSWRVGRGVVKLVVRFGIIGAGAMGGVYAHALATEVASGVLVAIGGGSKAPQLAAEFGVKCEPSSEALIARSDIDAVIIGTPPSSHLPLVRASAEAGHHVFVEKPMGRTVAECDEMIEACHKAGVLLTINKLSRFRPPGAAAKRAIIRGDVGDVLMIRVQLVHAGLEDNMPGASQGVSNWIRDPAEGTTYLDWGSHACDMIRWLSSSEPTLAFGQFSDYRTDPIPPLSRSGMAQYTLASGALAQVWCTEEMVPPGMPTETEYLVMGSEGTLIVDLYGALLLGKNGSWTEIARQPPIDYMNDPWHPDRVRGYAIQTEEFAQCISEGGRPSVSPEDGRAAIEMVQATEESARRGEVVRLPLSNPPGPLSANQRI